MIETRFRGSLPFPVKLNLFCTYFVFQFGTVLPKSECIPFLDSSENNFVVELDMQKFYWKEQTAVAPVGKK